MDGLTPTALPPAPGGAAPRPRPWARPARGWLRLSLRLVGLVGLTVWACSGVMAGNIWHRDPARRSRAQAARFTAWSRRLLRLFGVRLRRRGEPAPAPFFLVSNHVSYLDIPVLAAHLPCAFVAKAEIASWPIAGAVCRGVDTLFIDRQRKRDLPRTLGEIERLLGLGRGVIVFPEGTSGSGDDVMPFRSPLLELPVAAGLPVHYAAVRYGAPDGWPEPRVSIAWWGSMPLLSHLVLLLRLPHIDAEVVFGEEALAHPDRKQLAGDLRRRIRRLLDLEAGDGGGDDNGDAGDDV